MPVKPKGKQSTNKIRKDRAKHLEKWKKHCKDVSSRSATIDYWTLITLVTMAIH